MYTPYIYTHILYIYIYVFNNENNFLFTGYGVFVTASKKIGSFLLHYPGELITCEQGGQREARYKLNNDGCYLFFFDYLGKQMWLVLEKIVKHISNFAYT